MDHFPGDRRSRPTQEPDADILGQSAYAIAGLEDITFRRFSVDPCPFLSNQRCCEFAGGEIVVIGLSGFRGVSAVAGGGGARGIGAASCAFVGSGRPCG